MSATTSKIMGLVEWLMLLALSVLWGGSFFFGKVALAELPPFTVVFGRVCLAAIDGRPWRLVKGCFNPASRPTSDYQIGSSKSRS